MRLSYLPSNFRRLLLLLEKVKAAGFELLCWWIGYAMPFSTNLMLLLRLLITGDELLKAYGRHWY